MGNIIDRYIPGPVRNQVSQSICDKCSITWLIGCLVTWFFLNLGVSLKNEHEGKYTYMSARESELTYLHLGTVNQSTKENYTRHQCWCSSHHGEIFNILQNGHSLFGDEYMRRTARDIIYIYDGEYSVFQWIRAELWPVVLIKKFSAITICIYVFTSSV